MPRRWPLGCPTDSNCSEHDGLWVQFHLEGTFNVDRSTGCGITALGRYTLASSRVRADDTPVPVLKPSLRRTKTYHANWK